MSDATKEEGEGEKGKSYSRDFKRATADLKTARETIVVAKANKTKIGKSRGVDKKTERILKTLNKFIVSTRKQQYDEEVAEKMIPKKQYHKGVETDRKKNQTIDELMLAGLTKAQKDKIIKDQKEAIVKSYQKYLNV
jgi:hypothetical protein